MDPLSIIASVVGIVDAITRTYETIDKITSLPEAFNKVKKGLPLVQNILEGARERLNNSEPTDDQRKAILAIAEPCDDNVKELKRIFDELETKCKEDQGAKNWARVRVWYRDALRSIKAHRVESLMTNILKGVEKLAWNEVFKLATQEDLESVKQVIEELSKVEPSLDDSDFDTTGAIHANQTVAEGANAQQNNTQGGSHTFNLGPSGNSGNSGTLISGVGTLNWGEEDTSMARKPYFILPFEPDHDFVHRPDIMKWLEEQYKGPASRMSLIGMGGFGKSQVAIQFAYDIHHTSPQTSVFWVYASSKPRFEEAYRTIADTVRLPRRNDPSVDVLALVRDWLQKEEAGPWLMVLDNADDVNLFYPGSNARRDGAVSHLSYENPTAALELFRNKLQGKFDENAADLFHTLDYIPLAITQAAAYINRRAISVKAYLDAFRKSDKKKGNILNRDAGDLRRDETVSNSVVTTWQVTLHQIRREKPSAANLLSFMSFFNPQGIPKFILHSYKDDLIGNADGVKDDDNDDDSDDEFEDDLDVLRGYSLVFVTAKGVMCEMHTLVQFCTRVWLSVDNADRWKRLFLWAMSRHFPNGTFENWPTCQMLLPHVELIVEEEPPEKDLEQWASLLTNCAQYLDATGSYKAAEKLDDKAVKTWKRVLGEEHPSTLSSMNNLVLTFWNQGRWKEAEELEVRVMEIRKRVLGEEHPYTLASMNNLALTWKDQGRSRDALALMRNCVILRERVLGTNHPDMVSSATILADWEEASDLS
ncbi:hypothetical protein QQX98_005142 [Neonectria punicea]|uniref:NACHT-NTPase and P-loop NTPases N-terminal domain-containing protein n=1 Tax=Neonectria punicea TaxID=979145 RepID=A0ABR1H6M4_9HYPO